MQRDRNIQIGPHAKVSRRMALKGLAAAAVVGAAATPIGGTRFARAQGATAPVGDSAQLADLGLTLTAAQRAAGIAFLERHPSVDTHSHPGRFFLRDLPFQSPTTRAFGEPFEEKAIADLQAGRVSATLIAAVADARLLEPTVTQGLRAGKEFQAGEAYADYRAQLAQMKNLLANHHLIAGLGPANVIQAQHQQETALIFSVEGGDFIEDKLDRVHAAYRDGVRAITLVHYHINQIGDIQTEPPVHHGLTPLGKTIVREMNRTGIIIDLAHATFEVTKDAIQTSNKPVMVSHTNLMTPTASHPRLVSEEHAKMVAGAGGIIGSWPSGIGLASFADYIDAIARLVDAVGVEHTAIGTDMDANFKPVLRSYRDWSLIPAALLARGMHEDEVAKIMGGNFMRVFNANLGPRQPSAMRASSPNNKEA
jgi:membrane dipeptidase